MSVAQWQSDLILNLVVVSSNLTGHIIQTGIIMKIIQSILDNDLYKFTQQNAVLKYRQNVPVRYKFINRRPEGKFNDAFANKFGECLETFDQLTMTNEQRDKLRSECGWLGEEYIQYLYNYRFDTSELNWGVSDGELELGIDGVWERAILWEVPLMALISELYFRYCDTNWKYSEVEQSVKLVEKANRLNGVTFTDFGTRRRRSFRVHDLVVRTLMNYRHFAGTSNVHLALQYGVKPLGTMAHEWIMGISALESLRHANRFATRIWADVYKGDLGTALTDTFGTDAFFRDFDGTLARLFDSVRHDSGCPFEFTDKVIANYRKLRIDPRTKTIIFSDGLDIGTVRSIADYCEGKIKHSYGIGTNLTNDFPGSNPLNMVIKLTHCNGIPVVKLSDSPTKAIGDPDALRVARWTFFGTPLNEQPFTTKTAFAAT